MKRPLNIVATVVLIGTIAGCGGEPSGQRKGRFIDSAVEGLSYVSAGTTGITSTDGAFSYSDGDPVEFKVGDIVIGVAPGAGVITPVELVQGAKDETNDTVVNIARFLQSLDLDGDLDNGITIPPEAQKLAVGKSINFAQAPAAFGKDPDVLGYLNGLSYNPALKTPAAAQQHLKDTLLELLVGTWSGTFSGSESGTWQVTVTRTSGQGTIAGDGVSATNGPFAIAGTILTSGSADFGTGAGGAGGAAFIGQLRRDGTGSGTWSYTGMPGSGNWTGGRDGSVPPSGGNGPPITPPATPPTPPSQPGSQELTVTKYSPNKCTFETLSNSVACAKCAGLPIIFEVRSEHGQAFSFSMKNDTTRDAVSNGGGSVKLKATLSLGLNPVSSLEISCPTDGTPCQQQPSAGAVTLAPGIYALATQTYYCDGTGGTQNGAIATVATVTNQP